MIWSFVLILFSFLCLQVKAEQSAKDDYSLFHPTPSNQMREFQSDRPSSTNTPFTVDAGHFQVETELFNYSVLRSNGTKTSLLVAPTPLFRFGITNSAELQIAYSFYTHERINNADGSAQNLEGPGDTRLSFKENILGNEGAPISWAYMVTLKLPTDKSGVGNTALEPSILLPLLFSLGDFEISVMPEIDFRKNAADNAFHSEINAPLTLGHHLFGSFDGYAELVAHVSSDSGGPATSYVGLGLSYRLAKEMQIDLECNFGLNLATPQINPIAGWTTRF